MAADIAAWADAGLLYEVDEDGAAWLRLNRPEKRNAMDRPLRNALLGAIHEVSEDPTVRAAVITGNGVAFSSGADLTQVGGAGEVPPERRREGHDGTRTDGLLYGWSRLMNGIWNSEKPFLAAVNGIAAGGGCQLALGCDLILAHEDARFWEVFVRRGLPLEGGGAWILTKLTSLVRAKEMAIFGDPVSAADAERWGLVNRVVPAAEWDETVKAWAKRLASGPTIRIGHIKDQLNSVYDATMRQSFRDEVTFLHMGAGSDQGEAMRAYAERRDPNFTGN
ncbi:MAG TPA: enoyl-CoA hydratase-related protein [Acidimicrobiales bacterium]